MKKVKIASSIILSTTSVIGTLWYAADQNISMPYQYGTTELRENATITLQKNKEEAKNAATWAAKLLFSFILPE